MTTQIPHFIDGQRTAGTSTRTADVLNPSTGEVQAQVPMASTAEVDAAVAIAVEAQKQWAAWNPQRRARVMMKFVELVNKNADELAELLSLEHGKTVADSLGDIQRGVEVIEFAIGIPHLLKGEYTEGAGGGIDVYSDKVASYPYPRNPRGCGFVVTNSARCVNNLALPNLEEPDTPLTPERLCLGEYKNWEQQPLPAGFGWFPKTWLPRAQLAGILPADRATEQELRQAYAKLIPDASQREAYLKHGLPDMDFRFFNGASPGLIFPYLKGGERVVAENLSPEGTTAFQLPHDAPGLANQL